MMMNQARFPPFSRVRSSILPRSRGSFPEEQLVIEPNDELEKFACRLNFSRDSNCDMAPPLSA